MVQSMNQDLEQPCAAICSRRETMKRFLRLEIHVLHHILGSIAIAGQPGGRAEEIGQMRQCGRFEFFCTRPALHHGLTGLTFCRLACPFCPFCPFCPCSSSWTSSWTFFRPPSYPR